VSHHPILDDLSNPSQQEHFLNHINHDLENTAPLLIEEKLQHTFFSDLAQAMNEVPNAMSNSIFQKFYVKFDDSIVDLIKSEFENTQNIFLVNEAQIQSELEDLKSKMSGLEDPVVNQLNYMNFLINELNLNEHNRFEQKKRRICDLCSMCEKVNTKLNVLQESRNSSSH
ncbi:hypothetical protein VP01_3172g1, partial [Puccinia sorghi]